ncbi:DNA mismatch repair endonuclease MutL [Spirosoma utsteinense]|uniref:DNA mismatch repair protein MutL n=1 Tax=Spirosoma utsteinense TaxID=2585773 RepID=A0ABR6W0V0_9BACT|nr:DNA mismatch repair endonuclease MutL [Spirosoma utsteinense]MBC3783687.1 DNA mismatch repair protein MutL [Spirosoma utsteinense]MBC3790170.1 DNA mismatch repair protein MutL [Spirosoma utsteinense]
MLNVIQLLPDSIANQIAAGEVVQRPASVVKELLENSVDAKAKSIQVIIREAGRNLIQIVDDGAGMTETDARMSFERHATSKIRTSDDLFRIRTMGFRGEALASIAAVAQIEMRTRRAEEELGTLIRIEGSDIKAQESISCLPGTNLLIKNLFFNVPARRNFLKSNSVEMRHILDEFQRVALANPEVAFSLFHNDQEIYNLPAGKLSRRIIDMFGKNYREQLNHCDEQTPYVTVHGYIGKPESAKKARNEQFFFVNNRFVKHNYLHHAVVGAYEGTLPEGSHPFYVLFIEIDPSHIDINIHPTKTEIKFDDERSVYAIMMAAVRKAVGVYNLSPSLDFESDVNFLSGGRGNSTSKPTGGDNRPDAKPITAAWATGGSAGTTAPVPTKERLPSRTDSLDGAAGKSFDLPKRPSVNNWQALFEGVADTERPAPTTDRQEEGGDWLGPARTPPPSSASLPPESESVTLGSRVNEWKEVVETAETLTQAVIDEDSIVQVQNRYLIAPVKSGMLVIDQRRAYERILYDQFHASLTTRNGASQQLLFPKTVTLSPVDFQLATELRDDLVNLGFEFDELGQNTFVIRGVPTLTMGENEEELFANLLAQLRADTGRLKLDRAESLARSLARRSSMRHVTRLTATERKALIDQLFASANPSYTPTGDIVTVVMTLDKIAGLFR